MTSSKRLQRLKKYYTAAAVLLLNVIVLSLLLNALAWPFLSLYPRPTSPPFSAAQLQEVYPGMSTAEISRLLTETWEQPWQYEPWVGFRERPRRGKYVNVSDEGYRFSKTTDASQDSRAMQVYVFGGSTTFGYGVDDGSTIPARLQSHLDRLIENRRVEVVNFGRAYYARMFRDAVPLMQALETTVDGVTSFSVTDLLQDFVGQPFVDDLHYTAEVADAIAARIAAVVARDPRLGHD